MVKLITDHCLLVADHCLLTTDFYPQTNEYNRMLPLLKPPRLTPGQTIGFVAPASPFDDPEEVQAAVEAVESLGFQVKVGDHVLRRNGYLAGTDQERGADLNQMFADPNIAGIFALRGGYGSSRLLPALEYAAIQRHPKVLLGYSDITALLLAIHYKTGLVTFHGPVVNQKLSAYTVSELTQALITPAAPRLLGAPPPFPGQLGQVERTNRVVTIVPGKAQGRLIGGNLTLLTHLLGTPYFPDLTDKILFLEDVSEAVYRLDRMLTQLWLAGQLAGVRGIVLGKFTDCKPTYSLAASRTLAEVLEERCRQLNIPAVRGLLIGHVEEQTTLPIGCQVALDASAGTLQLLEASVG